MLRKAQEWVIDSLGNPKHQHFTRQFPVGERQEQHFGRCTGFVLHLLWFLLKEKANSAVACERRSSPLCSELCILCDPPHLREDERRQHQPSPSW